MFAQNLLESMFDSVLDETKKIFRIREVVNI